MSLPLFGKNLDQLSVDKSIGESLRGRGKGRRGRCVAQQATPDVGELSLPGDLADGVWTGRTRCDQGSHVSAELRSQDQGDCADRGGGVAACRLWRLGCDKLDHMSSENREKTLNELLASLFCSGPIGANLNIDMVRYQTTDSFKIPAALYFYCDTPLCSSNMIFDLEGNQSVYVRWSDAISYEHRTYKCRHCLQSLKVILLQFETLGGTSWKVTKTAEFPPPGPPIPKKLARLVGGDSELLLKGYQLERAGFGLGAFSYYRRVIENKKTELLKEIRKVAVATGADSETLESISKAITNFKFSEAVDNFKFAIPKELLIKGHNPLTLLHQVLSEGIHDQTDEECLGDATAIRHLLIEFSEKVDIILHDNKTLQDSVSILSNRKKKGSTVEVVDTPPTQTESSPNSD